MDSLLDIFEPVSFQRWKLPLGIAGISMTFLEMFFPRAADSIENLVDSIGNPGVFSSFQRFDLVLMGTLIACSVLGAGFLLSVALTTVVLDNASHFSSILQNIFVWAAGVLVVAILALVVFYLLGKILRFLNSITNGRALGAIGLLLLLFVLIGEAVFT